MNAVIERGFNRILTNKSTNIAIKRNSIGKYIGLRGLVIEAF